MSVDSAGAPVVECSAIGAVVAADKALRRAQGLSTGGWGAQNRAREELKGDGKSGWVLLRARVHANYGGIYVGGWSVISARNFSDDDRFD